MQDRYRQDGRGYDGPRRGGGRGGGHPGGHSKFEKISAMRRESRGAMLRRQISGLDLAESMLPPNVVAARDSALGTSSHGPTKNAVDLTSGPRGLMHDIFNCRDTTATVHNNASGVVALDAGDLAVAVESALDACSHEIDRERKTRSKIGGGFICRPEQVELIHGIGGKKRAAE